MLAASPNPVLSSATDKAEPATVSEAPAQSSVLDFEKKLKEAETKKTTRPAKNDLLARVQAAQQRSRMAQEKQKQEQMKQKQTHKEDESNLLDLDAQNSPTEVMGHMTLQDTKIAPQVASDTADMLGDFLDSPPSPSATASAPISPSAPPVAEEKPHFTTFKPVSPPASVQQLEQEAPPSFEQFEARLKSNGMDEEVFRLDADGNEMSPEQLQAMILEQEKIMKQIEEEKIANDMAIAALTAEDYGTQRVGEPETSTGVAQGSAVTNESSSSTNSGSTRTIEIAPNKRVALHGQDRTKEAIAKGTAVLVQCLYCQNWMQVTPTATLMFCPVCQVVSPVEHQSSVMTKDEAMQLSLDRKLAEKIQSEEYGGVDEGGDEEGFFSNFKASVFGSSSNAATGVLSEEHHGLTSSRNNAKAKQSWSEYLASLVPGAASTTEEDEDSKPRSAEIVVGRKSHPRQRDTASIYGGDSEEISYSRNDGGEKASLLQPGLVAENKPLFSCLAESVSTMLSGQTSLPQGQFHGVDTSSLLSVTDAGRNNGRDDGRGEYQNLNTY